jgi:hypothetical protein
MAPLSGSLPIQGSAPTRSDPPPAATLSRAEQKAKQDAANAQTALDTLKATAKSADSKPSRTAMQDKIKLLQARLKALMLLKSMHAKGIASEAAGILRELKQLVSDYQSLGPSPASPTTSAAQADASGNDSAGQDATATDTTAKTGQDQQQAAMQLAQSMQAAAKDPATYQNPDKDFYFLAQALIQQAHDLAKRHGGHDSTAPALSIRA